MNRLLVVAVALSISLVLSGCLRDGTSGQPAPEPLPPTPPPTVVADQPEYDFSTVVDPDHGAHDLPALHENGHGVALVGHAALTDILPVGVRGSITQVDVWGDYAVVSGMEGGLAFAIIDISDPAAPVAVSWYPSVADGWTARFSDDGNYVFYGCQMFGGAFSPTSTVRGTCEDPDAVHVAGENPAGVTVIDVSDKAQPIFVDFLAAPGSHNIVATAINGTDYVFTSSVAIIAFDRAAGELTQIAEVPGVHDAAVSQHPVTGDWLLYTGTGELAIWNVNDPADPQLVFEGDGGEGWTGWHEQTVVPGIVDGRVVLALAGESFLDTPSAGAELPDIISFVDITDPAAPVQLGTWQPPFTPQTPWVSYLFSVHEMAATPTGQVAIAWYHGGVWVVDVSTQERQAEPVTVAAYQPHELPNVTPATFAQTPLPYVPFVWGAGWSEEGYLIVPDMHTGLYVLEPEWGLHSAVSGGQ